jgi:outer membrane protein insertion porin family
VSTGFLWYKVEPNQEFQGLVCEGANVIPAKFLENSFRDGYGNNFFLFFLKCTIVVIHLGLACNIHCLQIYLCLAGKVINLRRLDEAISSINNWYMERGLFAMVNAP